MTSAKGGTARPGGTVFSVLLLLASASGLAQAGTVRGPAGSLELPEGISASVAPANLVHPNLEVSAVITLQQAATAAGDGAKVAMSCVPSSAGLGSRMGMERLAATTLRLDEALTADKDGEWITLDALPAYRVDAARGDGSRLTQWLVLLSSSFAWIRFDRPQATPIEQAVLEAIAGMKILCAAAAVEAPR